jgi:hypothetical protein
MSRSHSTKTRRRFQIIAASVALGVTGTMFSVTQASAAPENSVNPQASIVLNFSVNGNTTVKKLESDMQIGPGALKANLTITPAPDPNDWVGTIDGELTLPSTQASFTLWGLIPTTATVDFIPDGPITGELRAGVVTATSKIFVKLSNVKAGPIDMAVGDTCQTTTSAEIKLVSGEGFDPLSGGPLAAPDGYTIPEFKGCGLSDILLSGLISGPDNALTLNLARTT